MGFIIPILEGELQITTLLFVENAECKARSSSNYRKNITFFRKGPNETSKKKQILSKGPPNETSSCTKIWKSVSLPTGFQIRIRIRSAFLESLDLDLHSKCGSGSRRFIQFQLQNCMTVCNFLYLQKCFKKINKTFVFAWTLLDPHPDPQSFSNASIRKRTRMKLNPDCHVIWR